MFKKIIAVLIFLLSVNIYSYADSTSLYKNFKAAYNFEFSSMTVAKGILTGHIKNGIYTIHFTGKTTHFISIFYNLQEIIEGAVNMANLKSIYYESMEKRPKKEKLIYAKFIDNTTADVAITKNKKKKIYKLSSAQGIYSPLSLYLFFINNNMEIGKTYFRNVAVSKHLYRVKIKMEKYESINIDKLNRKKGKHKALKVELKFYKIDKNGKIKAGKNVKKVIAWISCSSPNIPILIESWNFIGLFRARLTKLHILE